MKKPGDVNGSDFKISKLQQCTVFLLDHTAQVLVDQCTNTTFVVGPVKGSIFFRDCKNCQIHVACGQFRCRNLYDSVVYLYVANDPIIESSNNLTFAPFNVGYPHLDEQVKAAGLNPDVNKWDQIFDFTTKDQGLNYQVMDPSQWAIMQKEIEGESQPVVAFGYPKKYGGTLPDNEDVSQKQNAASLDGGMGSFAIGTSQQEAEKMMEQQQPASAANDIFGQSNMGGASTFGNWGGSEGMSNSNFGGGQFGGSNLGGGEEDDLDEEERARVAEVQNQQNQRMQSLLDREDEERR